MSWKLQVKAKVGEKEEWQDVHPVGGKPYEYPTKQEAIDVLWMCYPGLLSSDKARVVKHADEET